MFYADNNLENQSILCHEVTLHRKITTIKREKFLNSSQIFDFFSPEYEDCIELYERFIVVFLDQSNKLIGYSVLAHGGITSCVVDVRLLFALALRNLATNVILMHNHPSGNYRPSQEDINLTQKISKAGNLFDIKVLDHLILTRDDYFSFADNGMI